jgi:DNA-directed RNA polymerase sigma subunit (sigma70/sigma32)
MIRPGDLSDRMERGALAPGGLTRPAARGLTARQSAVLKLIRRDTAQLGEPPSAALLARQLGVSRERVRQHVAVLAERGYLPLTN